MLAAHLAGISYSLTIHGPFEFDHPEILALGEKIKRCRFAVTISAYGRSQLCRWTDPADWPKIQVVRCGVKFDSAVMPPASGRNLISIGRLSPEKGHLVLLDAVAKLKNEPAFQITVVGDGPLRPLLEKRIVELGLAERVRLTGWLPADQVREEIIRSRAMVHASFAEGLPVVFMESLALGRPVIGTAIAGIPELIEPGISGWLVAAGSIEDLANAMHEALSCEPAKLAAMGQAGAARVRERHDQTFEARKLEKLFQKRIDKTALAKT
jgi:glycosyltransferase involved in cell wall biosynthesis